MPKATLEFKLPEEEHEHRQAINAPIYSSALWNFNQMMIACKNDGVSCKTARETIDMIFANWQEITSDINWDEA